VETAVPSLLPPLPPAMPARSFVEGWLRLRWMNVDIGMFCSGLRSGKSHAR